VGDDPTEHDQAGDHQRIAVAALRADEPGETDRAGGARYVLDDGRAHDPGALQHLLHRPGGLVPAAAGSRGGDETKLIVESLTRGRSRTGDRHRDRQGRPREKGHGSPPF
jgi:hypothetical protein